MKLLKPNWVTHDDLPIYSIDIHPDGSRFATGGQGVDSGRIVIWNMAPVVHGEVESDENTPKMLCQMDNHLACVNCVRWSFSGKFLASGGDDRLIMIWKICKHQPGGNSVFGGGGKVNVETWRCSSTLRGHDGDVLDLAWSPHDAWLASSSIDNTVIIWNALKMPEMVAVLKGHTGMVKGVAWDPVGKYIASQSDDKTLRVWRTSDWQQDNTVLEPFTECGGTTHLLRLSWSPDGQYLVSAHAMNGGGPTAQIIEREGWRHDKDFVGHRKAVTCVRFNSNIIQKSSRSSSKPQQYCCCAIGSRDRSLSVWLTALKRPLVVIHELFSNSVLDMSWSLGGFQLMACSWDGTVAYVEFSEEELGKPLTMDEKTTLHERLYGKSMACNSLVVETPELLEVRERAERQTAAAERVAKASEKPQQQGSAPMKGPINKQIETRTADGKRRITPMYIPPAPDMGDDVAPFGTSCTQQPTFSSSSEPKSRIVIEKRDDIVQPNVSASGGSKSVDGGGSAAAPGGEDAAPSTGSKGSGGGTEANGKVEAPKAAVSLKRRLDRDLPVQAPVGRYPPVKRSRLTTQHPDHPTNVPTATTLTEVSPEQPGLLLPALRLSSDTVSVQVGSAPERRVELRNECLPSPYGALTRVQLLHSDRPLWSSVLGSPALGLAANQHLVVVACRDRTLHLLDAETGSRSLPPLVLGAAPSRLALNGRPQVMAVTCRGAVSVWDVAKGKALVRDESLLPVMQSDSSGSVVTILSCSLTEQGFPVISLSTDKAYMFSSELSCWLLLGNSRDLVQRCSAHRTFHRTLPCPAPPLATLQCHSLAGSSSQARLLPGTTQASAPCTLAFLDGQLAACRVLQSAQEYRAWLLTLVRFLAQEDLQPKLRTICDDLMGPTHSSARHSRSWDSLVLGLSKRKLLREVLGIMGSNLRLQRLYTEYNDQLSLVEEYRTHNGTVE